MNKAYQNPLHIAAYDAPLGESASVCQDIEFYVELCKNSRDVLELACGTGRLLLPLVQKTKSSIEGIDYSQGMLDIAASKLAQLPIWKRQRVQILKANITDFNLSKKLQAI